VLGTGPLMPLPRSHRQRSGYAPHRKLPISKAHHSIHSISMLGMARRRKEAQSCRHSRDHPAGATHTTRTFPRHPSFQADIRPEAKAMAKLGDKRQSLPPQVAWCSFLPRM
jgi:hypothetical protein